MKCRACSNEARPNRRLCQRCTDSKYAWQKRNRQKGLCGCGKYCAEGKKSCADCLASMGQYIARRREERKAQGLCIDCGKPCEFQQVRCLSCGQKRRKGDALPVIQARRDAMHRQREQERRARDEALGKFEEVLKRFVESRIDLIADPRMVEIVKSRYLHKQTLEEVGNRLGITRERVRQIQAKADELLFSDVLVVDKSVKAVEREARKLSVLGLAPRTSIQRSTTGREFYQYLQRV